MENALFVVPISLWVFLATGVVLLVAWWRHTHTDSWQGVTFILAIPILVISGLVAAATLTAVIPATLAAREYTGDQDVWVKCDSWFGRVIFPYTEGYVNREDDGSASKVMRIQGDVCGALRDYWIFNRNADKIPDKQAQAIHVIAHEAEHTRGQFTESIAECDSIQRTSEMAHLLGGEGPGADSVGLWYYQNVYPYMPGSYKDENCAYTGP